MRPLFVYSAAFILASSMLVACEESSPDIDGGDGVEQLDIIDDMDAPLDVQDASETGGGDALDPDGDTGPGDASDSDAAPDAVTADVTPPHPSTGRAIGGVSMGAVAVNIALQNPQAFDLAGGLGGYIDYDYMLEAGSRLQLAGFCPLDEILAMDPAILNTQAAGCGPAQPAYELEYAQDFNHLHHDLNGGNFNRVFYLRVFQGLAMAFGGLGGPASEDSPYLPAGISLEWHQTVGAERCTDAPPIAPEYALSARWNPDGTLPVIPFCDTPNVVDPELLPGSFDPSAPQTRPFDFLLAVDINDNGVRDLGEPLFIRDREAHDDSGPDGCPSPREDGKGGCLATDASDATDADPNGDDYHYWDNPMGAEGNHRYDLGEAFEDLGLDGLPDTADGGEGNGVFDLLPAVARAQSMSAFDLMASATDDDLAHLDFYFDSGIRDPLHAGTSTRRVMGMLNARTGGVARYGNLGADADALFPNVAPSSFISEIFSQDMSRAALGRHIYVEYGNEDATPEEIAAGDGKHVGSATTITNRLLAFITLAAARFPDTDTEPVELDMALLGENRSFFSQGLNARRGYTVATPPGYFDPANADTDYPVVYFMHGHGQSAADLAPVAFLTAALMSSGDMPKVLLVFPDGACCEVDSETGLRECACINSTEDGMMDCMDPECTGPAEGCTVRQIPKWRLSEECNGGSLYLDLVTDRWANPRDDLGYGTSVMEVVNDVDINYRTRTTPESAP